MIDRRQEVEVTRRREEGGERRSSDENRRRDGLVCISCENKDETPPPPALPLDEAKTIEPSFSERPFRPPTLHVLYPLYCNVALSAPPDHIVSRLADHLPIWIIVSPDPRHGTFHRRPFLTIPNPNPHTEPKKTPTPQTTNPKPPNPKTPHKTQKTHQPHPVRNSLPSPPSPPVPVFQRPTAPPTLPPVDLLPCPSWIR